MKNAPLVAVMLGMCACAPAPEPPRWTEDRHLPNCVAADFEGINVCMNVIGESDGTIGLIAGGDYIRKDAR